MYIIISEEKMHHVTVPMILHRISDVQKTTEQPYIATEMTQGKNAAMRPPGVESSGVWKPY